ncbi:SDR family NAD(P)-dependent oxidoreductase [Sorangium sp. So ce1000]|uniref:SDR family NAD(P)-dependent oxidoreductase n=1 Tax=Sorangium sp. So ce1000 TaxID=3133325 RepID=UPI003F606DC0
MSKVALVTGANQGLGYAMVARLCQELPPGSTVYLGARDPERGEAAVARLCEQGLQPSLARLDVTDDASVQALAETVARRHGGIDIVLSNAAARIVKDLPQAVQVRTFINTNNHGTYRMIRAFGHLLRDGGRFLVVASSFGSLTKLDSRLHHRFDPATQSLEDVERVMDEYVELVERGEAEAHHWPAWINIPSKIAQVASMKIVARQRQAEAAQRGLTIAALCPGLVDTDASRPWFDDMSSAQSPADAAKNVLWICTQPAESARAVYGELVQHRRIIPWS